MVLNAACDDAGCLVAFERGAGFDPFVVPTTADGEARGGPVSIPSVAPYDVVNSITPDPSGFTLLRISNAYRYGIFVLRIGRDGTTLWEKQLYAGAPAIFYGAIFWRGDHDVLVTNDPAGGTIVAMDIDLRSGAVSNPRVLTSSASAQFVMEPKAGSFVLATFRENFTWTLYEVDATISAVNEVGTFVVFKGYSLVGLSVSGTSVVARLTLGSAPAVMGCAPATSPPQVLSIAARPQEPHGVAAVGSDYVVAWSEVDASSSTSNLYVARISSTGFIIARVLAATGDITRVLPITTIGEDALIIWFEAGSQHPTGAIVRAHGSVEPVDFTAGSAANFVVARNDDWLAIATASTGGIKVTRVARSGRTDPEVSIAGTSVAVWAAATDGENTLLLTGDESIVLAPDLSVLHRSARTFRAPVAAGFAVDSYLEANNALLIRRDRSGEARSSTPFAPAAQPAVSETTNGWLVQSGTQITSVVRSDPPTITWTQNVADLAAVSPRGTNRFGVVTAHLIDGTPALYFSELQVTDTPRRRAVVSR